MNAIMEEADQKLTELHSKKKLAKNRYLIISICF